MISAPATKKNKKAVFAIDGANAALYGWGDATMPDGSVLVGDYWNNRIVHYNDDGTEATPFVFTQSTVGFGNDTNQAPFGICVDNSGGSNQGDVYMTEGSLYNVIQYSPNGTLAHELGHHQRGPLCRVRLPVAVRRQPHRACIHIESVRQEHRRAQPVDEPGDLRVAADPEHVHPASRPRVRRLGNIWIADQGHHRDRHLQPELPPEPLAERVGMRPSPSRRSRRLVA